MQLLEAKHGKSMDQLLRDLYVTQGMRIEDVATELGQTKGTISRWLERFGIPARKRGAQPEAIA